jgi:hypothetical protein
MTPAARRAPRCPVPGCIARYSSGPDRLCARHRAESEPPRLVTVPTPGQVWAANRARAAAALRRDWRRSNRAIAGAVRTSQTTVMYVRRELERAGQIPVWRDKWAPGHRATAPRARAAAAAGTAAAPGASAAAVVPASGCSASVA